MYDTLQQTILTVTIPVNNTWPVAVSGALLTRSLKTQNILWLLRLRYCGFFNTYSRNL